MYDILLLLVDDISVKEKFDDIALKIKGLKIKWRDELKEQDIVNDLSKYISELSLCHVGLIVNKHTSEYSSNLVLDWINSFYNNKSACPLYLFLKSASSQKIKPFYFLAAGEWSSDVEFRYNEIEPNQFLHHLDKPYLWCESLYNIKYKTINRFESYPLLLRIV